MLAVTQAKTDHIQRMGIGMLAGPLAAGNAATGEAADMLDVAHRLAEHRLRGRLQAMSLEQGEAHRQRARRHEAAAQANAGILNTHGILHRAAGLRRAVGQACETQTGRRQRQVAQLTILAQTPEFERRQQVWRFAHIQRRPGVETRRNIKPATPQRQQ